MKPLKQLACQNVEKGSIVFTDQYPAHRLLEEKTTLARPWATYKIGIREAEFMSTMTKDIVSLFNPSLVKKKTLTRRNFLTNWRIIRLCINSNISHHKSKMFK